MSHSSEHKPTSEARRLTSGVCVLTCVMTLALFPTVGSAQSPATTFDELRLLVKDGTEVIVTDSKGRQTRGQVSALTTSSLDVVTYRPRFLVLTARVNHSFTDTAVTTVSRVDSTRNGAILGLVAGFGPVALITCATGPAEYRCFYGLVLGAPIAGLIGAGVGMMIDGRKNTIVYRTPAGGRPVTITLSPLLNPKTAGASVRLSF